MIAAGRGSSQEAEVALEELCSTYWFPLYVYVRRQTATREDAEDLTQAFFARFLEKKTTWKDSPAKKGNFALSCSRLSSIFWRMSGTVLTARSAAAV